MNKKDQIEQCLIIIQLKIIVSQLKEMIMKKLGLNNTNISNISDRGKELNRILNDSIKTNVKDNKLEDETMLDKKLSGSNKDNNKILKKSNKDNDKDNNKIVVDNILNESIKANENDNVLEDETVLDKKLSGSNKDNNKIYLDEHSILSNEDDIDN